MMGKHLSWYKPVISHGDIHFFFFQIGTISPFSGQKNNAWLPYGNSDCMKASDCTDVTHTSCLYNHKLCHSFWNKAEWSFVVSSWNELVHYSCSKYSLHQSFCLFMPNEKQQLADDSLQTILHSRNPCSSIGSFNYTVFWRSHSW